MLKDYIKEDISALSDINDIELILHLAGAFCDAQDSIDLNRLAIFSKKYAFMQKIIERLKLLESFEALGTYKHFEELVTAEQEGRLRIEAKPEVDIKPIKKSGKQVGTEYLASKYAGITAKDCTNVFDENEMRSDLAGCAFVLLNNENANVITKYILGQIQSYYHRCKKNDNRGSLFSILMLLINIERHYKDALEEDVYNDLARYNEAVYNAFLA